MSYSTLKPAHPKKLRELLQEKQEPFTLDIYLSERCPKKINLNSNSFKRTRNFDPKKIRKGLPNSSKVLKLVTSKLSSYRSCSKLSTCKCEDQRREKFSIMFQALKPPRPRELKASPSACQKFSNMFQALKPPRPRELKVDTTKCQCGSTVDIKQLIPISAEALSAHKNKKYVLITREEESKRVLRQTKQLLYEGANRETVGPKEHIKIICEKFCSWGKQSAYLKDIAQMINLDFSNEMEQWNNFRLLNTDIRIEIGDAILDDIVSEVI